MKIKSVTIGGFKNLKKTKINVDGIIVLISPNNFGKSNLLQSIDFGIEFLTSSAKDRKSMMEWKKGIPLIPSIENEDFYFEVEIVNPSLGDYQFIRYGYSFSWYKDDASGQKITDEWLDSRSSESYAYKSFLKRSEGKYRKNRNTDSFRKIILDDAQLSIDVLSAIADIDISDVIRLIQNLKYQLCSSLDPNDKFRPSPFEIIGDNEKPSIFDENDIPKALFVLKTNHSDKFDLFKESIFNLFPDFLEINVVKIDAVDTIIKKDIHIYEARSIDENENEKEIKIPFRFKEEIFRLYVTSKYLNQPIDIFNMSAGTKRVFWILTNLYIADCIKPTFIGIEELETSIHPRLLKNLLENINESLNNNALIISSHSPYLVQYLKPSQIYIGVPDSDGASTFRKVASTKAKLLLNSARNYDLSIGEYLFELMSGESDSVSILNSYLEEPIS